MRFVLAVIAAFPVTSAYALPNDPNGTPGQQTAMACLENTVASFWPSKPSITLGDVDILNWSIQIPRTCTTIFKQARLDGTVVPFSGSKVVQPWSSAEYVLTLPFSSGEAEAG